VLAITATPATTTPTYAKILIAGTAGLEGVSFRSSDNNKKIWVRKSFKDGQRKNTTTLNGNDRRS